MKLCVFPNDPLIAYFEKGEIKDRYYNPENFFDEIHFITLIEKDVEPSKVQSLVGSAKIIIHPVGKITIKDRKKKLPKIIEICKKINPDVIRSFNPLIEGWLAAKCAESLKKPFFISLHTQYDQNRKLARKNFKKFLALKYTEKMIEPYVLKRADKISIVYKIIESYVEKHTKNKPELVYNKVDCKKFLNAEKIDGVRHPLILSVGNLISVKNHDIIIRSMKEIDANLLIIGNGELYSSLDQLIHELKIENKVSIIKSVHHKDIQKYFKTADVFALAYNTEVESLPMPVMEAMASALPIVIPYPKKGFSDGLEESVLFSEMNSNDFSKNIKKILVDKKLAEHLSENAKIKSFEYDIQKNESKEAKIYQELVQNGNGHKLLR